MSASPATGLSSKAQRGLTSTPTSWPLAPLVAALQRRGLRRLPSVILVALLAAAMLGVAVWLVTAEVTSLAGEVPKYTENIKVKVKSLRHLGQGSVTGRLDDAGQRISRFLLMQLVVNGAVGLRQIPRRAFGPKSQRGACHPKAAGLTPNACFFVVRA